MKVPSQASIYADKLQIAEKKPIKRLPPRPQTPTSPFPPQFPPNSPSLSQSLSGPPSLVDTDVVFISDVELDID